MCSFKKLLVSQWFTVGVLECRKVYSLLQGSYCRVPRGGSRLARVQCWCALFQQGWASTLCESCVVLLVMTSFSLEPLHKSLVFKDGEVGNGLKKTVCSATAASLILCCVILVHFYPCAPVWSVPLFSCLMFSSGRLWQSSFTSSLLRNSIVTMLGMFSIILFHHSWRISEKLKMVFLCNYMKVSSNEQFQVWISKNCIFSWAFFVSFSKGNQIM